MTTLKKMAQMAVVTGFIAVVVFGVSGRTDLPNLWAYVALFGVFGFVGALVVDPELMRERRRPGPGGVDPGVLLSMRLLFLSHLLVGLLDVGRAHWTDSVPLSLQLLGSVLCVAGFGIFIWAMSANRFFSTIVRLQTERGHRAIDTGPYALVRHPGYLGMQLAAPGSALMLGSWASLVPALALVALVVYRTSFEDGFLRQTLAGYADYSARVKYRLIPGIW